MHQRKWLRAMLVLSSLTLAVSAQEPAPAPTPQDVQPGQSFKVAAHRSRWDYPKEITLPAGSQLHIVETGDTLWDLGSKYLGNPFSWPQIWEVNKWVVDPHWIYPGDPLVIPTGRQTLAQPGEEPQAPEEVAELAPDRKKMVSHTMLEEYAFAFQDFIQLPFLVPKGAEAYFKEIGALRVCDRQALEHSVSSEGEAIYLDGGAQKGLKVGDRLLVLKVVKTDLYHPDDSRHIKNLGDVVKQCGVVRITQVEPKSAVAIIEKTIDAVEVGDRLTTFTEPANMQLKLRSDLKEPIPVQTPHSKIIFISGNRINTGPGDMVIIDRGAKDGLKIGDVLLAVRNREWNVSVDKRGVLTNGQTNFLLGQMMVVKTSEKSSTCRLMRSNQEMLIGDVVTR